MVAVDWTTLTAFGAFIVGAAFGVIVTLRLAKILAQFFTEHRDRRDHREPPAPDTPGQ